MYIAEDLGRFYRIPADNRDLNYSKFFEIGQTNVSQSQDYNSNNTHRLNEKELTDMLMNLNEIQADLKEFGIVT